MSIGFACLMVGVPNMEIRSVMQKNATEERLKELIEHNLESLSSMIDYNAAHDINLFRICSDIIPFGSSPVNQLKWWNLYADQLKEIGKKAKTKNVRLSMHPGQYTVLNSPNEGVVENAVKDLIYHAGFLDSLGLDSTSKVVLHIGGIYGDKKAAIERFIGSYRKLPDNIKARLIIENDDKLYPIEDALHIGQQEGIPVVFDNLHHQIKGSREQHSEREWIELCGKTWNSERDGKQKVHYSQQAPGHRTGSHSKTIDIDGFLAYYPLAKDIDIMLEVKDKNLSANKCITCTRKDRHIKYIEQEWSRYKYDILERSPAIYSQIRELLKDKSAYPAVEFYRLIQMAQEMEPSTGTAVNCAQHVWGYFKDRADEKEKTKCEKDLKKFEEGKLSAGAMKRGLLRLAQKYQEPYLLQSYYFYL